MHDESTELMKTLCWVVEVITTNEPETLRRIAETYAEAQEHVATIPFDEGSARPRIVACFEHWNAYRTRDDLAGAGWVLMALQERVAERDLRDWPEMKAVADQAAAMLFRPKRYVH